MFTIVASRTTMSWAIAMTPRMTQRRSWWGFVISGGLSSSSGGRVAPKRRTTIRFSLSCDHMSLTDRPLRADAERNRKRILAAAAELFAERGLDVAIDEIAAKAEVGIGTVYRRFPDREALVDALFEDKIHEIEAIALEALRVSDPWDAFERFMRGVSTLHARDRGLKEAMLSDHRGAERACRARETIAPLGAMLLSRAQAAGAVREDLVAADVPLMHFAVGYIAEKTRDAS